MRISKDKTFAYIDLLHCEPEDTAHMKAFAETMK